MSQGTIWFQPIQRVLTSTAAPVAVAGAKAYFYLAGTLTPVAVYSDVGLTTAITQPVVADGNGIFTEVFLTPGTAYKVDIQTSAGVSLTGYPADNQLAIPLSSSLVSFTGTAGETLAAGIGVYLSDGSGSKIAGQWYKWDNANTYSSTLCEIGMVPVAIASGAMGSIQQAGQVTGLSGLSVGTAYYVGTAGALTATPNARFVGHADSTTTLILPDSNPRLPAPYVDNSIVHGRLTLTTAVPVTVTDVTGATSAFFAPYGGNTIALYDGTNWNLRTFAQITISLVGFTASKPYDIFAFDNAGVVTIETLVWTSTTARATALTLQDGVLSKTGVLTRRYIGTIYVNASGGQSDDSLVHRYVFNYYNRVPRSLQRTETTTSWNYTTATFHQANASATNQVEIMNGFAEGAINLDLTVTASNGTAGASGLVMIAAIGEDVTNAAASGSTFTQVSAPAANYQATLTANLSKVPALGYHFYTWLEYSTATGTTQWLSGQSTVNSGLSGMWMA